MTTSQETAKIDPRRARRRRRLRLVLLLPFLGLLALFLLEQVVSFLCPYPLSALDRFGQSQKIVSADGQLLRLLPTAKGERLIRLRYEDCGPWLEKALIAGEDRKFWTHSGVDFPAIFRAAVLNLRRGRVVSGASTLTMQLVRIVEPRPRTFWSKLVEVFRARQIERCLDKKTLMEHYLSLVPIGGNLRGFEAASWTWFGKRAKDLTPREAATLVAMLPAPSRRAPDNAPAELIRARNEILDRMQRCGYLRPDEASAAQRKALGTRRRLFAFLAPHASDWRLARARRAFESGPLLETGIRIDLQRRIEKIVRSYRSTTVDGLAVLVLDLATAEPVAMLGSRDWRQTQLNTCLCRRSAASTLKPFLYALALSQGVARRDGLLLDAPLEFADYEPGNQSEDYVGLLQSGEALRSSRNLPAIRLLQSVGVTAFRDLLYRLGLPVGDRDLHLDLALGSLSVSPLELGRAWCRFGSAELPEALELGARDRVLAMLRELSPDPAVLPAGRVAWKTGTSTNRRDAWTVGMTREHVVVVWLGNLQGRGSPELVGMLAAAPLFARIAAILP